MWQIRLASQSHMVSRFKQLTHIMLCMWFNVFARDDMISQAIVLDGQSAWGVAVLDSSTALTSLATAYIYNSSRAFVQ